jgi:hypothetical protein
MLKKSKTIEYPSKYFSKMIEMKSNEVRDIFPIELKKYKSHAII